MTRIVDYQIVTGSRVEVMDTVRVMLEENIGWEPLGGDSVAVEMRDSFDKPISRPISEPVTIHFQTMIKRGE